MIKHKDNKIKRVLRNLILSLFLLISVNAFSQVGKVDINVKNVSVTELFKIIEQQTRYRFSYRQVDVETRKDITLNYKNVELRNLLNSLLTKEGLDYQVSGNKIIVFPHSNGNVDSKQVIVKGKVADIKGEPIIGATILEKGTTNGTITDFDGNFELKVASKSTLEISYIGYKTQNIKVVTGKQLSVILHEDTELLDEVVVVGYGTQKKVNLTGSVAAIRSDEIVTVPVANVTNALAGKMPGVYTKQSSGAPGRDGSSINIRGLGNALIIVDGVESDINVVDPNEIESISVLKDGSAAIYGARAGNGVVLVTTKRGSKTKPTININSTLSFQKNTFFARSLNAGEYSELIRECQLNSGTPETGMMFTEEEVKKYKEGVPGFENNDWWNKIMKKSVPMHIHNMSLSGGGDTFKYYAFLGYTQQMGMFRSGDNNFKRYNMRTNFDGKITKNLTLSYDMSYIISDINDPATPKESLWGDIFGARPTLSTSLPDPNKIPWDGNTRSALAGTTKDLGGYDKKLKNQFSSTISLNWNLPFIKGLSVKALFNFKQNNFESKNWQKHYKTYSYDPGTDRYFLETALVQTSLRESYKRDQLLTGQYSIHYDNVFNEKHNLNAMFLCETIDASGKNISTGRGKYVSTAIDQLFAGGVEGQLSDGSASETGRVSYVGRINYGFEGKYLLEGTFRVDGSPNFPKSGRWGFFPSISAGWRLSEESFIKDNVSQLDNLKLRFSYSNSGYDAISAYSFLSGFKYTNRFVFDNEVITGIATKGLPSQNITWEKMTMYNVGVDFGIYNGKLFGEFDAFYRYRDDILGKRTLSIPTTFGALLPNENINAMSTRGLDIMLGHKNKIKDFSYSVSANMSWNRSKWERFDEPAYTDPDDIRINKKEGNWTNRNFGYKTDGLFTSQEEIDNHKLDQDYKHNSTIKIGDIKYIDQNGDNRLDWRDKVEIGHGGTPNFMFGFNLNLEYQGFDLLAYFQGAAGYEISVMQGVETLSNTNNTIYNDRWTETNNNKWAKFPRQYLGMKKNNRYGSDYWLVNGNYLRLKSLSIGYNFPEKLISNIMLSQARLYFSGSNLFTISKLCKYNIDPEGKNNFSEYPLQKVFTIGLNLKF